MWKKYVGFAAVFALFVILLRPDLIWGPKTNNTDTEKAEPEKQASKSNNAEEQYVDPRRPTLLVKDKTGLEKTQDGYAEYAEGYSEKNFSAIKEPEQMFENRNANQKPADELWETLLKLRFDISYDPAADDVVMKPMFTTEIKKYDNKTIEIEGYIIPNDIVHGAVGERGDGTMFMLSAFPSATCFFCKGAGPESVMEVYPKKPIPYSKNIVKIKGRLELNDLDYMKMAYILRDAQLVD